MFVYLITNLINGKRYVGQTIGSVQRRWKKHIINKGCLALNGAIHKYGPDKFSLEVICKCYNSDILNEFESEYILRYNTMVPNGYNLTTGGSKPLVSQESRMRMSESHKGIIPSEETKLKRVNALRGQKRTEEAKRKMSLAQIGNKNRLGDTKSKEEREKLSKAMKGNKNALGAIRTPEYCLQKSLSQIGRIFSEDTRRRMSESAKGKIISQITREKLSQASIRLGTRPPKLSSEDLSRAGRISGHKRYHVARGIINSNCLLCKEVECNSPLPV